MHFSFPPLAEQKANVEKVNTLMALCDHLENEIETRTTTQENWMQSCLREVFEGGGKSKASYAQEEMEFRMVADE